jgi:DNA-binding transcriptional LysR family regulator
MSLNLRQIRYFVAAAEAGKVVAAASAVGISPSAITEAIQELEETVGTPLMTRHRDGIRVTYDGYVFLQHCRNILSALTAATSRHRAGFQPGARRRSCDRDPGEIAAAPVDRDRASIARKAESNAPGCGEGALYPALDRRGGGHHSH